MVPGTGARLAHKATLIRCTHWHTPQQEPQKTNMEEGHNNISSQHTTQ